MADQASRPLPHHRGRQLLGAVALALAFVAAGCGTDEPPDTAPVLLAEGRVGDRAWRLEGRRLGGEPCVSLVLDGGERPAPERCGIRRTQMRHLDPVFVPVGDRVLAYSPLVEKARRVRLDGVDRTIKVVPARQAPGFPARFFLTELGRGGELTTVRVFAKRGRSLIA